jgi:hypothetical protein
MDEEPVVVEKSLADAVVHVARHPRGFTTLALKLFTVWNLTLVLLHVYTHAYVNLLLLSAMVMVSGLYMTYVYPRAFHFPHAETPFYVGWPDVVVLDIVFHLLPFLFVAWRYGRYYLDGAADRDPRRAFLQIGNALALVLVYLAVVRVDRQYKLPCRHQRIMYYLTAVVVVILCFIINSSCKPLHKSKNSS